MGICYLFLCICYLFYLEKTEVSCHVTSCLKYLILTRIITDCVCGGWGVGGWGKGGNQKVIGSTPVGSQTQILFFWAACVAD